MYAVILNLFYLLIAGLIAVGAAVLVYSLIVINLAFKSFVFIFVLIPLASLALLMSLVRGR